MFFADAPSGGCGETLSFVTFRFVFFLKQDGSFVKTGSGQTFFRTKGVSSAGSQLGSAHHERPIGKIISDTDIIDTFSQHVGKLKRPFLSHFMLKTIILPRQARDKHRKS
jgi:hypothetical protein